MKRSDGDIWVGDIIEFDSQPTSNGIIVSLLDVDGKEQPMVAREGRDLVPSMVIHQASDHKFAAWECRNLPPFNLTPRSSIH